MTTSTHTFDTDLSIPDDALKQAAVFYTPGLRKRIRQNTERDAWAKKLRDQLVTAAKPWSEMSDDALWSLMFGPQITRSWMVWSTGHCPACLDPTPMYTWIVDALNRRRHEANSPAGKAS